MIGDRFTAPCAQFTTRAHYLRAAAQRFDHRRCEAFREREILPLDHDIADARCLATALSIRIFPSPNQLKQRRFGEPSTVIPVAAATISRAGEGCPSPRDDDQRAQLERSDDHDLRLARHVIQSIFWRIASGVDVARSVGGDATFRNFRIDADDIGERPASDNTFRPPPPIRMLGADNRRYRSSSVRRDPKVAPANVVVLLRPHRRDDRQRLLEPIDAHARRVVPDPRPS